MGDAMRWVEGGAKRPLFVLMSFPFNLFFIMCIKYFYLGLKITSLKLTAASFT
jgi:hypothetical protein